VKAPASIAGAVLLALIGAAILIVAGSADARPQPGKPALAAFKRANPCPATGNAGGACPGYVVGYIEPLCAEGGDVESNMQWQTTAQARANGHWERQYCRFHRQRLADQARA